MADPRADWLSVAEARQRILEGLPRTSAETRPLDRCLGHVLAEPVRSRIDLPPWNNSGMKVVAPNMAKPVRTIATMDTATMRKRGNRGTTSRQVCVTSISTLRSGVRGNDHAPFWISGKGSDPLTDCNKLSDPG